METKFCDRLRSRSQKIEPCSLSLNLASHCCTVPLISYKIKKNVTSHLLERNFLKRGNKRREHKRSVHDDNTAKSSHNFQDSWNSFQQPINEPKEKKSNNTTPRIRSHNNCFFEIRGGFHKPPNENQKIGKLHGRRLQGPR